MATSLNNTVQINGRAVSVTWSNAAARELAKRRRPRIGETHTTAGGRT